MEEGSKRSSFDRMGRDCGAGSFVTMRLFGVSIRGTSHGTREYFRAWELIQG